MHAPCQRHTFTALTAGALYTPIKTPFWKILKKKGKIISDPQLGANLFCQEMNLSSPGGGIVKLKILPAEFALSSEDPLDGATFPI